MAGLRDLLNKGKDHDAEAYKICEVLRQEFPLVAEILGGMPAEGTQPAVSPGTITFFVREGRVRFSANVKSQEKTFIGEIADALNPWGCVNTALLTGDVSSKRYTDRMSGQTVIPEDVKVY